jgi:hypothetical protein
MKKMRGGEQTKHRFILLFFPLFFWGVTFSASLSLSSSKIDRETRLSVHRTPDYFYGISTLLLLALLYAEQFDT